MYIYRSVHVRVYTVYMYDICYLCCIMQAICNKGLKEAYQAWVHWLEDEGVSSASKCAELQALDKQGWCPLHYAARYYCPDILAAALDVEEGVYTCTCIGRHYYRSVHAHAPCIYMYMYMNNVRDNKQSNTIQHNSTTPETTFFFQRKSCLRWDSNSRHSVL